METKKTKKADLKNKSTLFLQTGFVIALGIVFAAFQWSVEDNTFDIDFDTQLSGNFEDVLPPVTRPEQQEQKKEEPPKVIETLVLADNEADDIDDIFMEDTEGSEDIVVDLVPMDTEEIDESEPEFFYIVEDMPKYPDGDAGLLKDIMSNIVYPEIAKENGIQGRVFVDFMVNKSGQVINVKIKRGVDPSLDAEALRVVKNLKNWTPGKQRGKAVKVAFTVPINFKLN